MSQSDALQELIDLFKGYIHRRSNAGSWWNDSFSWDTMKKVEQIEKNAAAQSATQRSEPVAWRHSTPHGWVVTKTKHMDSQPLYAASLSETPAGGTAKELTLDHKIGERLDALAKRLMATTQFGADAHTVLDAGILLMRALKEIVALRAGDTDAQCFRWLLKHHSGSGKAIAGVGMRCWIGGVEFQGDDVATAILDAIDREEAAAPSPDGNDNETGGAR